MRVRDRFYGVNAWLGQGDPIAAGFQLQTARPSVEMAQVDGARLRHDTQRPASAKVGRDTTHAALLEALAPRRMDRRIPQERMGTTENGPDNMQ